MIFASFVDKIVIRIKRLGFKKLKDVEPISVVVVDQIAYTIPLIRLFTNYKIVYYCHFPEKLLDDNAKNQKIPKLKKIVGKIYRYIFDVLESFALRWTHCILYNSKFTMRKT